MPTYLVLMALNVRMLMAKNSNVFAQKDSVVLPAKMSVSQSHMSFSTHFLTGYLSDSLTVPSYPRAILLV